MDNSIGPSDTNQPGAPSACETPPLVQWLMQDEVLNTTSEQRVDSGPLRSAAAVVEDCAAISLSSAELFKPADHAEDDSCTAVEVKSNAIESEPDNQPAGPVQRQLELTGACTNTFKGEDDEESVIFEYSPDFGAVEHEEDVVQNFQNVLNLYAVHDGVRPGDCLLDDEPPALPVQTPELATAAEMESPSMVVVSPVWVTPEHRHLLAAPPSLELGAIVTNEGGSTVELCTEVPVLPDPHVSEPCTNVDSLSALQTAVAADVTSAAAQLANHADSSEEEEEEEEEEEQEREAHDHANGLPSQGVGCDEDEAKECTLSSEKPESDASANCCPEPAAQSTTPDEEEETTEQSESPYKQVETSTELTMLLATPHRENNLSLGEASTPPKQSPVEKATASLPTIQQSEEEYALELETIQRKAEEQLRTYVQRQLQQKKQEFERKTQAAAVKLAAEWKQDGLTIDEIIDINFKAYAEQYEDLYTKALALKRTFEQSKVEFEHQVMSKYRELQQPRSSGWGSDAYAPQRIAFEESEEQDPLDCPLSKEFPAQAAGTSGQFRKKHARPFAGEITPDLKRAAIRKRFKVPAASTS